MHESCDLVSQHKRGNMVQLLRNGIKSLKHSNNNNSQFENALQSLQWRDHYCNADTFQLEINNKILCIRQLKNGELNGIGTGATVWPAACVLSKYLEHQVKLKLLSLKQKKVVELGCGTGIVGIALSMLGAHEVVLSDVPILKSLILENCTLNAMVKNISFHSYYWGNEIDLCMKNTDIVIVSDCVLPKLYPIEPLVAALVKLCQQRDTIIYMSYEYRYYENFNAKQKFFTCMTQNGFLVSIINFTDMHPTYRAKDIEIWKIVVA